MTLSKALISSGSKKLHFCGSWTWRSGCSNGHEMIEVTVGDKLWTSHFG
jgi:hypothetical protein